MQMKVQFIDDTIKDFVAHLEMPTSAKVFRAFELLEKFGNLLGMPHSRHVGKNLFELRIRGDQEIRLFYTFQKDMALLLHGFVKKTQRIPKKELEIAYKKLSTHLTDK